MLLDGDILSLGYSVTKSVHIGLHISELRLILTLIGVHSSELLSHTFEQLGGWHFKVTLLFNKVTAYNNNNNYYYY